VYHPQQLSYSGPWEQFLAAPFFNAAPYNPEDVQSIGIVGLAAGTTARQATFVYGPIPIDGWEIDPLIIQVGRKYFDMNMPNLTALAQDGRWGLEHSTRRYTIIGIDAYRPPYIPPHLTTLEFFQIVYERLSEDGVAVINVGRSPSDRTLIGALANTLLQVFPSVYVVDVPQSFNSIIYATRQPTNWQNLYANYDRLSVQSDVHPLLVEVLQRAVLLRQEVPASQVIFTDDRSPIEWITNTMVLSYVFFSDMQEIR
jgi:spermidine synthase